MAKKKDQQAAPADSALVAAAKTIGTVGGKVAAALGAEPKKSTKVPKLAPKNKARMPRRQKKALKKASQAKAKA